MSNSTDVYIFAANNFNMKKPLILIVTTMVIIFTACKTKIESSSTVHYSYNTDIKPIFAENCFGCHDPVKKKGGLDLTKNEVLWKIAKKGKLLGVINHKKGYAPMPMKNPKLQDEVIKKIDTWVKNGMPE